MLDVLRQRYWDGPIPACSWYGEAHVALAPESLAQLDDEARERGLNVSAAASPHIWIGDREAAITAFGGVHEVPVSGDRTWLIIFAPDWHGGIHYAHEMRHTVTPAGNDVWYLEDTLGMFPDDDCQPG